MGPERFGPKSTSKPSLSSCLEIHPIAGQKKGLGEEGRLTYLQVPAGEELGIGSFSRYREPYDEV